MFQMLCDNLGLLLKSLKISKLQHQVVPPQLQGRYKIYSNRVFVKDFFLSDSLVSVAFGFYCFEARSDLLILRIKNMKQTTLKKRKNPTRFTKNEKQTRKKMLKESYQLAARVRTDTACLHGDNELVTMATASGIDSHTPLRRQRSLNPQIDAKIRGKIELGQ